MPFDSRKQQQWYNATDQTYLDDEPHDARKVKEADLTTSTGGEIPVESSLKTPDASNSGFEVTEDDKTAKRERKDSIDDDEIEFEGEIYTKTSEGKYHNVEGKSAEHIILDKAHEDLSDLSRRWDNTSDQLKREWELPEIYINAKWDELDDSLQNFIKQQYSKWLGESKAKEEGLASVSGPPADSNMNMIGDEEPFVLTSNTDTNNENLTDEDLTKEDLTSDGLGESIILNENYIELGGVYYKPVYADEHHKITDNDIIFEGKYYTTEGLGNCVFCQGAGKVTVERLGLKDCPDCDGTGDVEQQPMGVQNSMGGQMPQGDTPIQPPIQDPSQQQPEITQQQEIPQQVPQPDPNQAQQVPMEGQQPDQPTGQDQIPQQPMPEDPQQLQQDTTQQQTPPQQEDPKQQEDPFAKQKPKKPNPFGGESLKLFGNESKDLIFDIPKGGKIEFKIAGETRLKIEDPKSNESCGCKKKSLESNIKKYKTFVSNKMKILLDHAKAGEAVNMMYGMPTISKKGKKIKGTLAYAGVSLNDRIYLPEELAKGDGKTLPLLLNHSSIAGAEEELDRLDEDMINHLENEKDYQVGEVTLRWDQSKLTLFYEGVVTNKFFQSEIYDMDMAVSLGIFYDSDSPEVCDVNCYTLIKGAEFREVSLVYHAGFPIATIEAVEAELKHASEDHIKNLNKLEKEEKEEGELEHVKLVQDITKDVKEEASEDVDDDDDPNNASISMKELEAQIPKKPKHWTAGDETPEWDGGKDLPEFGEAQADEELDIVPRDEDQTVIDVEPKEMTVESFNTMNNFSMSGINGITISNINGVEKYKIDPSSFIHLDVGGEGADISGEALTTQLQPKMTTPADITKELESRPDIEFTSPDEDAFK